MRNIATAALLVSALLASQPSGNEPKPRKDKEAERLDRLLEQLGDDEFDRREEASKELEKLGTRALPALIELAATTTDLEVRTRTVRLVRAVMPAAFDSKSTKLALVRVQAGSFRMGSPGSERGRRGDEAQHAVKISRPFFLGAYEVTQAEYAKVMKATPSWFAATGGGKAKVQGEKADAFPVETVSWYDALEFCNRLSQLDGLTAYYKLSDVQREDGSITRATVALVGGSGYRLPTEAEWEYACRAGSNTAFHFGEQTRRDTLNVKPLVIGSGYGTSLQWPDLGRTAKVGSYARNAWGLYDMHGNAGEWCWDYYDKDYYDTSPAADPKGPDKGKHRVMRGGSWLVPEASARSASRFFHSPDERKYYGGFRVARNP